MTTNGMRWDKFLPKMVLRVLLVEPDDSTRHIISLLLRKCNYKVATVSDGLKAWQLLNGNSHSIDLILTEMELPSISGFALLSLITGHDVCKNIPVIMMSPYDSVTTVYKCMLKGAADFLVKPVRKNELSNMWQHVWRRQAVTSDCKMLNEEECQAPQKVEATAENNATSNSSGGYMHKRENIEKESDPQPAAQSSCTKPEMDADESHTEMRWACDAKLGTVNPSKEAIDLIGSFDRFPRNHACNQVDDPSSMLDLSLMSSHPSSSKDEKQRLNQSDASAFSRYTNKPQPSGSCQHGQDENESQFSSPKQRMIAVRGSRFDNPYPGGSCWN